jgi:hypothetical protein
MEDMLLPLLRPAGSGFLRLLLAASAGAASAGCGASRDQSTSESRPTLFVGTIDSSDAVVGLEIGQSGWVFYSCGGPTSLGSLTHWFSAGAPPGALGIDLSKNGWSLKGQAGSCDGSAAGCAAGLPEWGGTLIGSDGVVHPWSAAQAPGGSLSGLYDVTENGCRTGLLLSQGAQGDVALAQGTWCDGVGDFEQVTPIRPVERTDRGIHASVNAAGFVRDLYLAPVRVPLQ